MRHRDTRTAIGIAKGRLRAGQQFSWSWASGGEPSGTIKVRSEVDAVVLMYCIS
jgi:hypothetical protein